MIFREGITNCLNFFDFVQLKVEKCDDAGNFFERNTNGMLLSAAMAFFNFLIHVKIHSLLETVTCIEILPF